MAHKIVAALMIWGLILQPLSAAMPGQMSADTAESAVAVMVESEDTMAAHHAMSDSGAPMPPCHEMVEDVPDSMDCSNCNDECASGACLSSCSMSSPAITAQSLIRLAGHVPVRVVVANDALVPGPLTRIFHPPKHA